MLELLGLLGQSSTEGLRAGWGIDARPPQSLSWS